MLYPTERELIYVRRLIGRIVKSPIRLCPVIVRYLERAKVDGSNGLMPKVEPVHHQLFQVHGVAWRTGWRRLAITYNAVLFKSINRFDVASASPTSSLRCFGGQLRIRNLSGQGVFCWSIPLASTTLLAEDHHRSCRDLY